MRYILLCLLIGNSLRAMESTLNDTADLINYEELSVQVPNSNEKKTWYTKLMSRKNCCTAAVTAGCIVSAALAYKLWTTTDDAQELIHDAPELLDDEFDKTRNMVKKLVEQEFEGVKQFVADQVGGIRHMIAQTLADLTKDIKPTLERVPAYEQRVNSSLNRFDGIMDSVEQLLRHVGG